MIPIQGLGLLYVVVIYIGGISLISKLPFISSQSSKVQIIVILITHNSFNYELFSFTFLKPKRSKT